MSEKNGLTAAEEEMLTLTMEECAELIQACSKVLRFGRAKFLHPAKPTTSEMINEEAGDVLACLGILKKNGLIDPKVVEGTMVYKLQRLKDPEKRRVHFITPDMLP